MRRREFITSVTAAPEAARRAGLLIIKCVVDGTLLNRIHQSPQDGRRAAPALPEDGEGGPRTEMSARRAADYSASGTMAGVVFDQNTGHSPASPAPSPPTARAKTAREEPRPPQRGPGQNALRHLLHLRLRDYNS